MIYTGLPTRRHTEIELLTKLINFDTSTGQSNLRLIEFIEEFLANLGVQSSRVYGEAEQKANLVATIGPQEKPGYILSGHTDVVPANPAEWKSNPFVADLRNDRIYGRGASDMKGFLAVVLSKVQAMVGADLNIPLHLAFSYDEEIGCIGIRDIIRDINSWPVKPLGCIVGEPTGMEIVIGHKGKRAVWVDILGRTGHSSLTGSGVNAIEYAARLISYVRSIADEKASRGPFDELFDVSTTTGQTGVIIGGSQVNIIPNHCGLEFEFRFIGADSGDDLIKQVKDFAHDELIPEMRTAAPEADIKFRTKIAYDDLETAPEDPIVTTVKSLAGKNSHSKVSYGAEAGLFSRQGGIPSVLCGPGYIAQAHQPDEYIELEQLSECSIFIDRLIAYCSY